MNFRSILSNLCFPEVPVPVTIGTAIASCPPYRSVRATMRRETSPWSMVDTAQYVYDAFNRRVHTQTGSTTTEYTYDYAGRRISSWLSPNNTGNEGRIYWDGQQFGYRSSDGTTYYDHQDTLGTERMRTDFGDGPGASFTSLPWGDGYTANILLTGGGQDNRTFCRAGA